MPLDLVPGNRVMFVRAAGETTGAAVRFPIHATWTDEPELPVTLTLDLDADQDSDVLIVRRATLEMRLGVLGSLPVCSGGCSWPATSSGPSQSAWYRRSDAEGRPHMSWHRLRSHDRSDGGRPDGSYRRSC